MVYGRKRQEIREELDEDDDPKGPGFLQLGAAQKVHGIQRGPGRRDSDQGAERPKSRFVEKLLSTKKRRDVEKLMRDERKQQKERAIEGEQFKDKEVFVTSNYQKQLETSAEMRKKLVESDYVDEATSVQGQKMWRSNFGKMLMNTGLNGDREEVGDPMKLEGEELESSPKHKDTKSRSPIDSRRDSSQRNLSRRDDRRSSRGDYETRRYDDRRSRDDKNHRSRSSRGDYETSRRDDRRSHKREYERSRSPRDRKRDERQSREHRLGSKEALEFSHREAERVERERRMKAIREILKQRNTREKIDAARQRALLRRQAGFIVPPV